MHTSKSFRRTLLLGFMLAAFVPLICLGFISYTYLGYKVEEFANQRNGLLAETVATDMSSYLRYPLTVVQQIGLMLNSGFGDHAEINEILDSVARESDYLESIYVIDAEKRIVNIGLDRQYGEVLDSYLGMDLSSLGVLKNIEYLQGPFWSNFFLSPVSGERGIALIHAVDRDRYIVGLINIEYLHSFVLARSQRKDISIMILDDNGTPVFHPQLEMVEEQQSFANIEPYQQSQLGNFGTYQFAIDSESYLGSTANIAETKWLVVVVQPEAIAKTPLRNMTRFFVFAALFSVVIVIILAIRQSRRLFRPFNDLQKNIQAVADGDYQADISRQSYEEFEEVATHFRHMATAIERREQLLEVNEERLVSLLEVHNLKELSESELLQFALEQAVSLTRSEIGYLHMLGEDEITVTHTVWSQNTGDFVRKNDLSLQMLNDFGLGRASMHERRNIIKNAQNTYGSEESGWLKVSRQLSVPIFDGAKIVAVVGVLNKESIYDKTDARQLSLYFNHSWDILQQKRYEKDRSRMAEQLAHAQKLEAIGTLAGGIAHDFNNVLMVILGNAELAKDNIGSPDRIRQDLDQIYKGTLRARDLVNQILAFSRDKAEGLRPLDIRPIVKEAVKLLRASIPANIEIRQNIANESHPVVSEPGQISQLIMNLATNAYQAINSGDGILEISLGYVVLDRDFHKRGELAVKAGEYMELTVRDNGKGIPENMINRIFEPYFTTREKEQGTGLGLAVVHGIVKSLQGAVTVESEEESGTVFKVYLPVAKTVSQSQEQIVTGKLPGGSERILYVDDDESVAMVNSRILEGLGYTVTVFLSSREAYEYFRESGDRFDLVITDMAMPEMTGDVMAEKIKDIQPDIPIILCTGFSESMDENRAGELGIDEVLMKPITKFDLALTVRKILGFA